MPKAIGDRKICSACRTEFPLSSFDRNRAMVDGLNWQCHSCAATSRKLTRERNPEKYRTYGREWHRQRRYGLSAAEYEAMTEACDGKCQVCGLPPKLPFKILDTDHDHVTGKVRGLLCRPCNTAIGVTQENPAILRALADYIETHKERT